jgi:YVTN family beta-propeller protein
MNPHRRVAWRPALLLSLALGSYVATSMMRANPAAGQKPPNELWVTSQATDVIHVLEFPGATPVATIVLPAGAGPHIVTFHAGKYAYVSGMGDGTLYVIDADARQVVKTMKLGPAGVHQARVSPDGTTALITVVPTPEARQAGCRRGQGGVERDRELAGELREGAGL